MVQELQIPKFLDMSYQIDYDKLVYKNLASKEMSWELGKFSMLKISTMKIKDETIFFS